MPVTRSTSGRKEGTEALTERARQGIYEQPPASPSDAEGVPTTQGEKTAENTQKQLTEAKKSHIPPRPASIRSTTSATARLRQAEYEAEKRMLELRRKEIQMEAELIKKKLAWETAVIQDDEGGSLAENLNVEDRVDTWLDQNVSTMLTTNEREEAAARGEPECQRAYTREREETRRQRSPTPAKQREMEQLAEVLQKIVQVRPPPRQASELPIFTGAASEWLPFRAAMKETTQMYNFTATENIARLRNCLKGEARETVSALLATATSPEIIMKTLEQCYGRPEVIIDLALEQIRKLPKPGPAATDLNNLAVKLQNIVCTLQQMDKRGYLNNPMLTREVITKLSPHTAMRWCDYAEEQGSYAEPEIVTLSRFLMQEANRSLRHAYAPTTTATLRREERKPHTITLPRRAAVHNVTEDKKKCYCCQGNHELPACPKFKAMEVNDKWKMVVDEKICFKCLIGKHRRMSCRAKPCGVNRCKRPHHSSLHYDYEEEVTPAAKTPTTNEAVLSVAHTKSPEARAVLLKMCPVTVRGPRGEADTYALLDEGATITLIDEDLANEVGAKGTASPLHLHGVNMSQKQAGSKLVTIQVQGRRENATYNVRARTIKNLALHQQVIPEELMKYEHLRDLNKEDICYAKIRPRILVGTDHWEHIVSRELRVGGPNEPAASRTQLGWVVHGTVPRYQLTRNDGSVLHLFDYKQHRANEERNNDRLHDMVDFHFKIDALGVAQAPRVSDADQRAIAIVKKTIRKIEGGYEVGLPWRRDEVTMPPSYDIAYRRLRGIEKKMDASPEFAQEYTAQIEEFIKKGYATPCEGTERKSSVCWYLPHFAVRNPNKPGKQRIVFDAAATSNGASLNSQLLEGPDMLLSLPGILFRFRERAVAVTADIQEMFLRIKIRKEDQPAQQFLWRGEDRDGPPRHYKMTSMIFGAASSPFTAHYVRDYNAKKHATRYPRALEAITTCHYMDDYVASYDTIEEAQTTIRETIEVHKAAGFTLRKWSANKPATLRDVPATSCDTSPTTLGGDQHENKILGLIWNSESDALGFNTSMNRVPHEVRTQARAPTKREALSAVMSIYDPLGLLSHFTIRAKIILQNLWRLKTSWDEPIPATEEEAFASWLAQLQDIARLQLERCYAPGGYDRVELHILCDASEQAYATVAYWRYTHTDGRIKVVLAAAKAKVAPQRTQTIPRLELQAAVIGARIADSIKKEHTITAARTLYWSDSSTVIHWIRNDAKRYTPFVAHRLSEISELTQPEDWRWLPTADNTADDATRSSCETITIDSRWFQGPHFLYEPEERWPGDPTHTTNEDEESALHITTKPHEDSWLPDPSRFSKYETLVRAAARALAFIDMCRRSATCLEYRHVERAEAEIIRKSQQDSFNKEIEAIKSARPITKGSRLFQLDPVLQDGLLKVRGRIQAADAPVETKQPLILDGRHRVTKLIVLREHCAAGHANRERVTNDLRQRYWIIHLRPTVRAVERNCALCQVRRSRPKPPAKGDLPRARLDPFHRAFTNCGVDYFGPMIVKVGRRREKRWGALFTCLTTRAVHIELVPTLSTDSALMALRRMAARRGWPKLMYSDNATNFRGADHELRAAYNEWGPALKEEGHLHRMEWRFIPPGAPNQGGAWERLVRSVKAALSATLREREPTDEVLKTLLAEAEFSINARPLTHVSVDARDPEALTPNHFLLGSSTGLPSTGPCEEADRRTWRATQALADHFWRRWLREYLPTLVPRGETQRRERPLKEGDVVLVADSTLPRNVWPMGIVTRTYEGPDGGIRVADVRTRTGTFKRPVSKLVVLQTEEAAQATPGGGC